MTFSESTIQDLVQKYYGLTVTVKSLNGYDELNFLLSTDKNEKYIQINRLICCNYFM